MASAQPKENPTDPAIPQATEAAEGDEGAAPSKKGAKKAEAKAKKEAEKARRAAEREAAAAASSSAVVEDLAKDNYGDVAAGKDGKGKIDAEIVNLRNLGEEHIGKTIKLRAWIQNFRAQGAKMAFVELREEGSWTIQGVASASADGKVSKQMVKWIQGLRLESFISVEAVVQKPLEPVKSCRVSNFEVHLTKVYLVAPAPEMLGLNLAAASRPVGSLEDESAGETAAAVEGMYIVEGKGRVC